MPLPSAVLAGLPTVMPIYLGTPMDENPPGAGPNVIFTATYQFIKALER
jgi:hypothetical protein